MIVKNKFFCFLKLLFKYYIFKEYYIFKKYFIYMFNLKIL